MKWALACLALAFGGWLCLSSPAARPAAESARSNDRGMSSGQFRWQGAASCSAAACHGGNEAKGSKRSEYSTWVEHDVHACAYSILFNEQSRRIARNLQLPQPAHESYACLPCHASSPPETRRAQRFQLSDGVSCETCHGPAEKWLGEHYVSGWDGKSNAEKEALGFRNTKGLLTRARVCVDCHVGHRDADVNHDLIAAGHPRLTFEYSAFLTAMPKHWSEQDEQRRYPDFDARAWLIGQAATAQAALELLAERTHHIWPEFAEYDCRACHHDLTGASSRSTASQREAQLYVWNDWYTILAPRVLAWRIDDPDSFSAVALAEIRNEMRAPWPDAGRVRHQAGRGADQFRRLAGQITAAGPLDVVAMRRMFVEIQGDIVAAKPNSDVERQRYYGLTALYRSMGQLFPQQLDPQWKSALQKLGEELKLPPASRK